MPKWGKCLRHPRIFGESISLQLMRHFLVDFQTLCVVVRNTSFRVRNERSFHGTSTCQDMEDGRLTKPDQLLARCQRFIFPFCSAKRQRNSFVLSSAMYERSLANFLCRKSISILPTPSGRPLRYIILLVYKMAERQTSQFMYCKPCKLQKITQLDQEILVHSLFSCLKIQARFARSHEIHTRFQATVQIGCQLNPIQFMG